MLPSQPSLARRLKRVRTAAALACLVLTAPATLADTLPSFGPGVAKITVEDNRTDRALAGHIWYPTPTPDLHAQADKSKVWQMAPADPDGRPADGPFPLVVVSHGMYGNTFNQAWLGSQLSRRGYIVAMVNHPGTSTFLRDPEDARRLWERPVDLSRLISYLLETSPFRTRIDPDRIFAAGHSLGGMTVMMLAGARFDSGRRDRACSGDGQPVVCKVLNDWSVAGTEADRAEMTRSYKDERLAGVISLDLGGTPVFSRDSLGAVDMPVLVLGSGRADMLDQDTESRALAAALPQSLVHHVELADAGHFDFMGLCKPEGFAILEEHEPGDEIVCFKGGKEREAQHRTILSQILAFLQP